MSYETEVESGVSPEKVTLEKMEALITACVKAKDDEAAAQEEVDRYAKIRHELEREIQQYLEYFGKNKYSGIDGMIEVREMQSFRTPKTEEQKEAFFNWLDSKGIKLQYLTVNSQALNGLLKAEYETAKETGKELIIPGIEAPTIFKRIFLRKAK